MRLYIEHRDVVRRMHLYHDRWTDWYGPEDLIAVHDFMVRTIGLSMHLHYASRTSLGSLPEGAAPVMLRRLSCARSCLSRLLVVTGLRGAGTLQRAGGDEAFSHDHGLLVSLMHRMGLQDLEGRSGDRGHAPGRTGHAGLQKVRIYTYLLHTPRFQLPSCSLWCARHSPRLALHVPTGT